MLFSGFLHKKKTKSTDFVIYFGENIENKLVE